VALSKGLNYRPQVVCTSASIKGCRGNISRSAGMLETTRKWLAVGCRDLRTSPPVPTESCALAR
jgi:hypothetical protein